MNVVKDVLEKQQKSLENFKPISVNKHIECKIDVGSLLCSDPNDLDLDLIKKQATQYLLDLTRDNTQLLINKIWELPVERVEETVVAKLLPSEFVLPRARKIPVPKPLTKWEKFAKEKGIVNKKKDKKLFDTELDKWVPTYGFKKAAAETEKTWVLEVPQNADPLEDQFAKKKQLKDDKVAKNEIKRMKNIARAHKVKMPRVGYVSAETASSKDLLTAVTVAKSSTASVGKFQDRLIKEKDARGTGVHELIPGAKRKASHISAVPEKKQNLELINSILNKKPMYNLDKAISVQKTENRMKKHNDDDDDGDNFKSTKGNKHKGTKSKGNKKPKGSKGVRNHSKRTIGRKRR